MAEAERLMPLAARPPPLLEGLALIAWPTLIGHAIMRGAPGDERAVTLGTAAIGFGLVIGFIHGQREGWGRLG